MGAVMTSRQAAELDHALERNGYTAEDVKRLCNGDLLARLLPAVQGNAVIQMVARVLATVNLFDPVAFIGTGWKILKKESDKRAKALTQVDFTKVSFETCLKEGETRITGEEKLKRFKDSGKIRLGAETFLALWQEKDHATLESLHKEKGLTYLDFFGDVLESPSGLRCVLCLYRRVGRWSWCYSWLDNLWYDRHFSVSLAS